MDYSTGIYYNDLMGDFGINISDPVAFTTISVDNILENTPGGNINVGNTLVVQKIEPDDDDTRDIGSPSKRFANAYIDNIDSGESSFTDIILTNTSNQILMGTTNTTTLNATPPLSSIIYTFPDVGTDADFVMTQGAQTIAGAKGFSSQVSMPTVNLLSTSNQITMGSSVKTFINANSPVSNRTYTLTDVGGDANFILSVGSQTLDSKTFTNMANVEILQRSPFSVASSSLVGINKSSVDGNCYFDHGTSSTSGFVFRNNNGASTLLTVSNTQVTSSKQLSISNTTDTSNAGASTASVFTSGGQTVTKSLFVGTTLYVADIQARSGQHLTIQPNGNLTLAPTARMQIQGRNSDSMSFYGNTTNTRMQFLFGKHTSSADLSLGICQSANDFVTGSSLRDIVIQPIASNQTVWTGVSTTPFMSTNSTQTKIYPTTISTSTTTGALVCNGGAGFAGNVNSGGAVFSTGAFTTNSGILLPTGGGSATLLDYYEEVTFNSVLAGNLGTASPTMLGKIIRIGKHVTYSFETTTGLSSSVAAIAWVSTIPSRFIPATDKYFVVMVQDGASFNPGLIFITGVTGVVVAYSDTQTASFSSGTTCGVYGSAISWTV